MLDEAQRTKIEKASTIRIDSTVTESDIHEPTDSSLLGDSVRVMIRLLKCCIYIYSAAKSQINSR